MPSGKKPLRVAVIGAGAFGRNHLRVYRELSLAHPDLVQLVALVEPDATRRSTCATEYNIPAFASVAEMLQSASVLGAPPLSGAERVASETCVNGPAALKGTGFSPSVETVIEQGALAPEGTHPPPSSLLSSLPDCASICVPTLHHAAIAEQLLLAGIDILIEKPFAATLDEADRILALAAQHQRIVAIGHLERFNPAVTATLAALHKPMFFESHRLSVFTPRSLDVDVVLDLMIHDLDIVLTFAASPVREVRAVGLPILSRKTDIANVRIEFVSGCVANFTASRVSTEQVRKLRLFQPHQYLSLDFARQELLTIAVDPAIIAATIAGAAQTPATAAAPTGPPGGSPPAGLVHPTAGLALTRADISKGEPLRLELEDFLNSVRTRTPPRVTAEAGRAALALALEINREIATHAHRAGLT